MSWGFAESLAFAAVMTLRDMTNEKNTHLFKTQKFYQECYQRIADDSSKVFDKVIEVTQKASHCYTPSELGTGSTYLPLYCFALVIQTQGRITKEQNKIVKLYFDNMTFPFSQTEYLNAVKNGSEIGDFRKVISISKSYVGGFWVNFFRALYKSGTQKDLQNVVDCTTSMIIRFSVLGNPDNTIANNICSNLVNLINYHINEVKEITLKEIDWLGVIPIPDRLEEMKKFYESLIDNSNITEEMSKEELLPLLELLILNSICDIVMLTKQPKSIKVKMMNEAYKFTGITTEVTPEEYVKHIANNTELGTFYKYMFSSIPPLGAIWQIIAIMSEQTNRVEEGIAITSDVLSILIQVENFFAEKYNFLGEESISQKYMSNIINQLMEIC